MTVENFAENPPIEQDALNQIFVQAHTAYRFDSEYQVSDEDLVKIQELVVLAPTAMNSQPMRITWVKSREARERLAEHMSSNNKERTLTAPMTAILSYDDNYSEHMGLVAPHAVGMTEKLAADAKARRGMGEMSSHLEGGYFILALRALGFATGPMAGFSVDGVNKEFFEGTGKSAFMVVNFGRAGENAYRPRAPRLSFEQQTESI
ncbi:malonic semialdehyde reductase [Neomicrococcus aestuarii]|uniref:Malonic semialdehyde reductase n=1 Tax=Neomicrococcus aestuarii TaxID=556325 RepID=A0A1L2ZPM3_9MICC|nr:malonic semialdehyde reductase [Neomicrococcus aestuarii]APF41130.1 malonic semialdehyde reductase [Neomicrococcus aestuarii]